MKPLLRRTGAGVPDGLDAGRIEQLRELRAEILRMPRKAKAQLRLGPQVDPACGVCSADHAGGYCGAGSPAAEYHEVHLGTLAGLIGADDFADLAAVMPDEADPLIKALSGALAAERSLVIYLLAGWRP